MVPDGLYVLSANPHYADPENGDNFVIFKFCISRQEAEITNVMIYIVNFSVKRK